MFQNFSQDFAKYKDASFINLNNGTLGLCPSVVIEQQKAELEIFERNTSSGYGDAWARLWKIQQCSVSLSLTGFVSDTLTT